MGELIEARLNALRRAFSEASSRFWNHPSKENEGALYDAAVDLREFCERVNSCLSAD
jgi:hypothetical protein